MFLSQPNSRTVRKNKSAEYMLDPLSSIHDEDNHMVSKDLGVGEQQTVWTELSV